MLVQEKLFRIRPAQKVPKPIAASGSMTERFDTLVPVTESGTVLVKIQRDMQKESGASTGRRVNVCHKVLTSV
jgi:hypothetical protein